MTTNTTASGWLLQAALRLNKSEQPRNEASLILAKCLNVEKSWLLMHPDFLLPPHTLDCTEHLLKSREHGYPLPYLLGQWPFYGLDLTVTPDVLIPRPETETLVEAAIQYLAYHPNVRALDVGTGSGCIPIAVCAHASVRHYTATDRSPAALRVATANLARYQQTQRISLVQMDLTSGLKAKFGLITANLPYIPAASLRHLQVSAYEPALALDGGEDGLVFNQALINQCRQLLDRPGLLLAEMQFDQGKQLHGYAQFHFPDARITILKDLAGHDRVLRLELQ